MPADARLAKVKVPGEPETGTQVCHGRGSQLMESADGNFRIGGFRCSFERRQPIIAIHTSGQVRTKPDRMLPRCSMADCHLSTEGQSGAAASVVVFAQDSAG
jgi:hypothetical protein